MRQFSSQVMLNTFPEINYWGYFTSLGAYGISNINWVKHLRRIGVKVYPHPKFAPQPGQKEWEILNDEEREIFKIPFKLCRVGIIETTPFDLHLNQSEIKIANTMAESDRLGEAWVRACNGMNHILVPNEFQKEVFERSGVSVPISVIPHGTETEKFPYFKRPQREVFTFGTIGWFEAGGKEKDRKGIWYIIEAFLSEFSPNEPVRLVIKSSNKAFGFYRNWRHNITVMTDSLSQEELNKLYQSFDCFLFPSKAEGIGQPPREAAATGLPVILTDYSGLHEIAKPEVCYPIQPNGFENRLDMPEQPGKWATIDVRELMYWMRWVFEHQDEARRKGKGAANWIRQHFSWETAAHKLKDFLVKNYEQML